MEQMRKVLYKEYIPAVMERVAGYTIKKHGTGCIEPEYTRPATFLAWGLGSEKVEGGVLSSTVAILEFPHRIS